MLSSDDVLHLFDLLPRSASKREANHLKSFAAGAYVHGPDMGLRTETRRFPESCRILCRFVQQSKVPYSPWRASTVLVRLLLAWLIHSPLLPCPGPLVHLVLNQLHLFAGLAANVTAGKVQSPKTFPGSVGPGREGCTNLI